MQTKSFRRRRASRPSADTASAPEPGEATRPASVTVGKEAVLRRIRACADACECAETRASIHGLVRAVRRGAGTASRAAAVEAASAAVVARADDAGPDRWEAAEAAVWALSRLTRRRPAAGSAGRLLEQLMELAARGAAALGDRDTRPARFAIVLARVFADVEACRELDRRATAAVGEELGRLVTADGGVVLSGSAAVVERVCRWTAVRDAAVELDARGWCDELESRWAAAAAAALRLLGSGGRAPVGGTTPTPPRTSPWLAALAVAPAKRARRTARVLQSGKRRPGRGGALLPPDLHDAPAATAVIRSGWERDAVRVLVEYRDSAPHLEIAVGDRLLVSGPWEWRIETAGRPLDAESGWTVAGWESGRAATFLEISAPLAGGMRLERQVVLLRRHRVVLLADAVVPADAAGTVGECSYRSEVQLAPGLTAEPAAETREVLVYDGAMRCMALPLALPEWRTGGSGGFAAADGRLVLHQSGHRRLYAPLWIDCDPGRIGRPLTWRQLTVADTRRNLPAHQAAGFRVQAGHEQWLLYRALDVPRNRTLLGCNVSSGFLLGRIKRSGEVARTVEIE